MKKQSYILLFSLLFTVGDTPQIAAMESKVPGDIPFAQTLQSPDAGAALLGLGAIVLIGVGIALTPPIAMARAKAKWGNLAIGIPAMAFEIRYTPENLQLLEAANNKDISTIKQVLRQANQQTFGTLDAKKINSMILLCKQIKNLQIEESHAHHDLHRAQKEAPFLGLSIKESRARYKAKKNERIAAEQELLKYGAQASTIINLLKLYAATDFIYNKRGAYKIFFGLKTISFDTLIDIKKKLDQQPTILS